MVEGVAEEVADPGHVISRRILFRKSQEMFARMRVDPERYFESWISVGGSRSAVRVTSCASFDGTKAKGAKYSAGTRLPTDSTRELLRWRRTSRVRRAA